MEHRLKNREFGTLQRRRKVAHPATIFFKRLALLIEMLVFLALIFGLFRTSVSYGEKIYETDRKIAKAKSDIKRLDREIEAMRNEQAKYSDWTYIKGRIDHYNLGLIAAPAEQQVNLVIKRTINPAISTAVQTAAR